MKMNKEQRKRAEKENKDRRIRDHDDREPDNNNNNNNRDFNVQRLPDKKKSARKVEGFVGNANGSSYDDKDTLTSESVIYGRTTKIIFMLSIPISGCMSINHITFSSALTRRFFLISWKVAKVPWL